MTPKGLKNSLKLSLKLSFKLSIKLSIKLPLKLSLKFSLKCRYINQLFFKFLRLIKTRKNLLGFSFLSDDHYNINVSSGEKVNPQRCFI